MDKRVFSGIKPSGNLHLGNYIGALRQWVQDQEDGFNIFCIVDLHAITVPQEPSELRKNSLDLAAMILGAGIDPTKSLLFVQSHNPDHANLGWVLNCYLSMGQMNRMTQYKEKSEGKETVSVGLFDYPALMAADILLYGTTHVPVGDDQRQHVELTRDVAERFNGKYGEVFQLPAAVTPKVGGRVMSLTNPLKKMSKSVEDPNGTIGLLDTAEEIRKKIMSATTDSDNKVAYDTNRAGIANLIEIYNATSEKSISDIEKEFESASYKEFKEAVSENLVKFLRDLQEKYEHFRGEEKLLSILKDGSEKAQAISNPFLKKVYNSIGFI